MGLDAVEMVICIEQAFGVQISDDDASEVRTVGDLFNLIVRLKGDVPVNKDVCLSAAVFFRIRRELLRERQIGPNRIRPAVRLDAIMPQEDRRKMWMRLQRSLGWRLPQLERPRWVVAAATIWSLAAVSLAWVAGWWIGGSLVAMGLAIGMLLGIPRLAMRITMPLADRIGADFATFRGLSEWVLARNYAVVCEEIGGWDSAEAWESLKRIIVEQVGVRPEKVTRKALLVNDLGLD